MRTIFSIAATFAVGVASYAAAAPADHARMPAQKAFDSERQQPAHSCMNGESLLSHTAYTGAINCPLRCSELLSTDTLMKIRHWDRT